MDRCILLSRFRVRCKRVLLKQRRCCFETEEKGSVLETILLEVFFIYRRVLFEAEET